MNQNIKDPIIILGTGRCGSTLLQRILNTDENIIIWGEHAGFLKDIAKSYFTLTESQQITNNYYQNKNIDKSIIVGALKEYRKSINWVNSFDRQSIKDNYRNLIINLLNDGVNVEKNIWGFKEIVYSKHDRTFDMLLNIFPSSKFIFSLRHPFNVIASMVINWNDSALIEKQIRNYDLDSLETLIINYAQRWDNVASSFKYWSIENKANYCIEKYENLVNDPKNAVEHIFKFIDLPMPKNALKPMTIKLESSHGYYYKSELNKIILLLSKDIWKIVGETAEYFDYDLNIVDSFKLENKSELLKK